jgi:hypothetical protein
MIYIKYQIKIMKRTLILTLLLILGFGFSSESPQINTKTVEAIPAKMFAGEIHYSRIPV